MFIWVSPVTSVLLHSQTISLQFWKRQCFLSKAVNYMHSRASCRDKISHLKRERFLSKNENTAPIYKRLINIYFVTPYLHVVSLLLRALSRFVTHTHTHTHRFITFLSSLAVSRLSFPPQIRGASFLLSFDFSTLTPLHNNNVLVTHFMEL
jgi:hypothetical protein